jgi:large subunit ribosomal protein L21
VDDDGKTHVGKEAAKAVVVAKLVGEQKGDKVKVFKYRPKTRYQRRQGHRQMMTLLEIQDVRLEGKRSTAKAASTDDASSSAKDQAAAASERAE